ncbi:uncharacterized protein LOC131255064 [Magnolia sinica]|uniref:uncharacterized protein LOC131255064 n=1 Tax=Magnolia sinica TaxID=86752 RepID=UPI002659AF18|nr:uncharacterized protein LOC131255064 [Magnolia sinica]
MEAVGTGIGDRKLCEIDCLSSIIEDITPTNEESHPLPLTETSNSIKEIRQWLEPCLVKIEEKIDASSSNREIRQWLEPILLKIDEKIVTSNTNKEIRQWLEPILVRMEEKIVTSVKKYFSIHAIPDCGTFQLIMDNECPQ